MESIYVPVPNDPVNIELSIVIGILTHFNFISDVKSILNSPLIQCILSNVNVKPTNLLKL